MDNQKEPREVPITVVIIAIIVVGLIIAFAYNHFLGQQDEEEERQENPQMGTMPGPQGKGMMGKGPQMGTKAQGTPLPGAGQKAP